MSDGGEPLNQTQQPPVGSHRLRRRGDGQAGRDHGDEGRGQRQDGGDGGPGGAGGGPAHVSAPVAALQRDEQHHAEAGEQQGAAAEHQHRERVTGTGLRQVVARLGRGVAAGASAGGSSAGGSSAGGSSAAALGRRRR